MSEFQQGRFLGTYSRQMMASIFGPVFRFLNRISKGHLFSVKSVTTDYTVGEGDSIIIGDASGGTFNITLPAADESIDKVFKVKKVDATANITLVAQIDGAANMTLTTQYESKELASDGTEYWTI